MVHDIYYSELHRRHLYDGLEEDICLGERMLIPGPTGELEVLTSGPQALDPTRPIVILCHPHPLYGGSLSNKVVHILAESFNELGLLSISFNFRGVGRSGGRYDNGEGETDDLVAVVNWFRQRFPEAPVWIGGFSFGAYVAARGYRNAGAERLLLVAPPVTLFDFTAIPAIEVPWMVIQGGRDEIIEAPQVSAWVHRQPHAPDYRWMAEADHFFHGRLNRIRETVKAAWGVAAESQAVGS